MLWCVLWSSSEFHMQWAARTNQDANLIQLHLTAIIERRRWQECSGEVWRAYGHFSVLNSLSQHPPISLSMCPSVHIACTCVYVPVKAAISSASSFCAHTPIREQVELCKSMRSPSWHEAPKVASSLYAQCVLWSTFMRGWMWVLSVIERDGEDARSWCGCGYRRPFISP